MKYIQSDITTTDLPIAHGVNCQNKMGSGVAKALYTKWPEVKEKYHEYCEYGPPEGLLGRSQRVTIPNRLPIFNLFTQLNYGYDGKKYVSYKAIVDAVSKIQYFGEIAVPKIGCGLAGGDWNVVSAILEEFEEERLFQLSFTVYYL